MTAYLSLQSAGISGHDQASASPSPSGHLRPHSSWAALLPREDTGVQESGME